MAYGVKIKMGDCVGRLNLVVVLLDDFDIIFGNDFFVKEKVALMAHLRGVLISDKVNPCFVPVFLGNKYRGKTRVVSSLQLGKSLRRPNRITLWL